MEISGLFNPICMISSTEGESPPEMMNWIHTNLQIEVEKRLLIDDLKKFRLTCPGQYFSSKKFTIVLPILSGVPSISCTSTPIKVILEETGMIWGLSNFRFITHDLP